MVLSLVSALIGLAVLPQAFSMNVSNVLIYSYTAGFRHDSIPTAVASLVARGPSYGINFVNSEDPLNFTDTFLSQFDALFFLHNTDEGEQLSRRYIYSDTLPLQLLCDKLG